MRAYLDLMQKILDEGTVKSDRTGTATVSPSGHQTRPTLPQAPPPAPSSQTVPAPVLSPCSAIRCASIWWKVSRW